MTMTASEEEGGQEVEYRGEEEASQAGVEGSGHSCVGNELRVYGCHAGCGAGGGAHDAAECHSGLGIINGEGFSHEGGNHHNQYGFDYACCDGDGDDFGRSAQSCTGNRSYDEGSYAGADGHEVNGTGVSQGIRYGNACHQADEFSDEKGSYAAPADFLDFMKVGTEGGGNDGEVSEHGAAHQAHACEERNVGDTLAAAGDCAADVGQYQAQEDGNGAAMYTALGEAAQFVSYEHDDAKKHEGENHAVFNE